MNPLRAWLGYLTIVLAGGATLSPWLWHGVQWVAPSSALAGQPFHRYVNRCLLALAIIGLWPLRQFLGVRSRDELGLNLGPHPVSRFCKGLCMGLVSLGIVALLAGWLGARHAAANPSGTDVLRKGIGALTSALVVGLIEEALFRGALHTSLRRVLSRNWASAWSSGVYALVHFFQRPPEPHHVNLFSGWFTLGQMFLGFIDFPTLVPGFLSLFLVGWILATARDLSGGLSLSWGLHAGWIFWLKIYGFFTAPTVNRQSWFWGSEKMIDGWVALIVLCFMVGWTQAWLRGTSVNAKPSGIDKSY